MFQLCNVYTKQDTLVRVTRHDSELDFNLTSLISKRTKAELDEKNQFSIINAYLDFKGDAFKDALFSVLTECDKAVMDTLTESSIYPLPYHIINPILDLFNLEEMFNFIKYEFKLPPPSNLAEVFNTQIETDARGSRVQTYLKDDYLQLAALTTIFKIAMLPVFNYTYIKQKDLGSINREYTVFHLFKPTALYNSEPMVKVKGLIQKLIEQTTVSGEVETIRVLEKQIPKDELPFYILAIVMIQKVAIAPLVDDDEMKNIVTKIYNYVNNKLKSTADVSKAIRNKTTLKDVDGLPGDSESFIESHRQLHSHSPADIIEFEWSLESVDKIISQMPLKQKNCIDVLALDDAKRFTEVFNKGYIQPIHVNTLAIIFKSVIDPRALDYVKIECLTNLLTVAFGYLWGMKLKNLALLLTSIVDVSQTEVFTINSTVNKSRIPKEIKEELDYYFPYKRCVNNDTYINLAEEAVSDMAGIYYDNKWIPTADKKYIEEVIGNDNYSSLITADLRTDIATFIVKNEQNLTILDS